MNAAAATPAKNTPAKEKKPVPTPAEIRKSLGLAESATDTEVRAAQKVVRFKSVAERRTNAALQAMANLARCANRGNYTYTDEQVNTIFEALENEISKLHSAFTASATADKPHVQL